jgi:transcriptional regulator with XRE-family HTH domain
MLDSLEAKERLKNLMALLLGEVKGSVLTDLGVRTVEELGIVPMTRAEMSRRLSVSETAIGLWRSARVGKISPENLEKIANLAGRNGSELVLYIKGEVDLKSFLNKERTIRSLAEILAEIKQRPMSELPEIIMTATETMQQHMAANEKTLAGEIRSWMRLNRVSQVRLESMLTKSIPPVPQDRLRRILGGDTPSDGELGAIAIILGWGDKADIDELREIYGLKQEPKKTHPNQAVAC